jgi:galactoside O-acetyltransferase
MLDGVVMNSFMSLEELSALGLNAAPTSLVSRKASFYGASRIWIGPYSRIDDFCVLSAGSDGIHIGRNVHIATGVTLIGEGSIEIGDFAGLSGRVSVYSSNDDYSGRMMTNPTVPKQFLGVDIRPVRIDKHVIVGSSALILPGVIIEEGAVVGAYSLVKKNVNSWTIVTGTPARFAGHRKRDLLQYESEILKIQS